MYLGNTQRIDLPTFKGVEKRKPLDAEERMLRGAAGDAATSRDEKLTGPWGCFAPLAIYIIEFIARRI
jgi:hypothetical protein